MTARPPEPPAHEGFRDDLAAYALGALTEDEAATLRAHLEECEQCRTRLRWLHPAVDLLPRTVEQLEPPARLRRRLIATVRAEAREGRNAAVPAATHRTWRDWWPAFWRPATVLAASVLLAAGAVGGYLLRQPGESSQVIAAKPSPRAPEVTATLERQDGSAILRMASLPALPGRDVYEVWVRRGPTLEPSSLFAARRNRTAEAAVPGSLDDADAVLVTREPHGGSRHPTSRPLLSVRLQ